MDDYMREIDANKPPITGKETLLRLDAERMTPEMRLRNQLMTIVINAVNDANVMRAVQELEHIIKRSGDVGIAKRDALIDGALDFIERIALRSFPDAEVNGEIIGEAQALVSTINAIMFKA